MLTPELTRAMQLRTPASVVVRTVSWGLALVLGGCSDVVTPATKLPSRIASPRALESMVAQSVALSAQVPRPNEEAWKFVAQSIPSFEVVSVF